MFISIIIAVEALTVVYFIVIIIILAETVELICVVKVRRAQFIFFSIIGGNLTIDQANLEKYIILDVIILLSKWILPYLMLDQGAPRSFYKAHYALGFITWLGSTPTLSALKSRNSEVDLCTEEALSFF